MNWYTIILWTDDCEQHVLWARAEDPIRAGIYARASHADQHDVSLEEVEAVAVIEGTHKLVGDTDLINMYAGELSDVPHYEEDAA
ncbi:hypothetical protein [Belnapia sp. F-4-1]|uniref:hypothetical protein n=1 Tax=Belnapia sp. F-4-1 TaxID=1545443 RepID=UPI0005BDC951|nr:hypothetical protein [Belnapia sp. F-4-1]